MASSASNFQQSTYPAKRVNASHLCDRNVVARALTASNIRRGLNNSARFRVGTSENVTLSFPLACQSPHRNLSLRKITFREPSPTKIDMPSFVGTIREVVADVSEKARKWCGRLRKHGCAIGCAHSRLITSLSLSQDPAVTQGEILSRTLANRSGCCQRKVTSSSKTGEESK